MIFWGIRYSKQRTIRNRLVKLSDVLNLLRQKPEADEAVIFGVIQEYSMTEIGFLIRDSSDQEIGKAVYKSGRRQGWLAIDYLGQSYEASTLDIWNVHTVVLKNISNQNQTVACTFRGRLRRREYEIPEFGVIHGRFNWSWDNLKDTRRTYSKDGKTIGSHFQPGNTRYSHRLVALSQSVPVPVQIFMMVMG